MASAIDELLSFTGETQSLTAALQTSQTICRGASGEIAADNINFAGVTDALQTRRRICWLNSKFARSDRRLIEYKLAAWESACYIVYPKVKKNSPKPPQT